MNKKPTADLESALETVVGIQDKLAREAAVAASAAAELAEPGCGGDLEDEAMLARVGRLSSIAALAPRRQAALREKLQDAQKTLVAARDAFFRNYVQARFKDLQNRAVAKAEKALAANYGDPNQLREAALLTDLLRQLPRLSDHFIGNQNLKDAVERARGLIALWGNFDHFETQNLS